MKLNSVILPAKGDSSWDIEIRHGIVEMMRPAETGAEPRLLLEPLCHAHIHLDKPYILTCNHGSSSSSNLSDYSDLVPKTGSFQEALSYTSKAKERYTADDLYLRGSQLLAKSYQQGVTSVRAFVELDHVTQTLPLATAIKLKQDFAHLVEVQICAFAQDAIFSTAHGNVNRSILSSALEEHAAFIGAIGATPYVEESRKASLQNIEWAITMALKHDLHLDFHLDYNLDSPTASVPLTYSVIELLQKHQWTEKAKAKTIVLGHCTQLSVIPNTDMARLAQSITSSGLPIHFVGLPTSDLFMMGRRITTEHDKDNLNTSQSRPRGTLQVLSMINDFGLSACLAVNNVGNAFTPHGNGDPLYLASTAVGIYQAGTEDDARSLYDCVSLRAKKAIGLEGNSSSHGGDLSEGCKFQPMLLIEAEKPIIIPGVDSGSSIKVPGRRRISFKDVVWDPPDVCRRSIIRSSND